MTDELHVGALATAGDRSDFLSELIGEDGSQKGSIRVEITRTAATTWGLDSEDAVIDAARQLSKAIFAGSPAMQVGRGSGSPAMRPGHCPRLSRGRGRIHRHFRT